MAAIPWTEILARAGIPDDPQRLAAVQAVRESVQRRQAAQEEADRTKARQKPGRRGGPSHHPRTP